MTAKHSEAFIEQALVKVFSRGDRSVKSVAEDLNVGYYTLKYWMKSKSVTKSGVPATREKRPQDWTAAEQLVALQETHGLSAEALGACQGTCRLSHAAKGCLSVACEAIVTTDSRSGLRVTAPIGVQSRVQPDQRAGLRSRAWTYTS